MYLIEVIPFARGIAKDSLSYFSKDSFTPGSLVTIPLRSKSIYGLVLASREISQVKSEIKDATFALKKITAKKSSAFLLAGFLKTIDQISEYYVASKGAVLFTLLPKVLCENLPTIDSPLKSSPPEEEGNKGLKPEKYLLQASEEERYGHFKSIVREEFAKGRSVYLTLATTEQLEKAAKILERGIGQYTFLLHNGLNKKELLDTWKNAIEMEHPILIIGTAQFLHLPRPDIKTIIIEKENSGSWKQQGRPYLDLRTFAVMLAENIGARIILADTVLRIETIAKLKDGTFSEFVAMKWRPLSDASEEVVDMRVFSRGGVSESTSFVMISPQVKEMILDNKKNNEFMFVYATRRGLAPSVICGDCGTTVVCKVCDTSLVLHGSRGSDAENESSNYFLCHKCGSNENTEEFCRVCQSWKLYSVGIGSERVEAALTKEFEDVKIFRLDSDSAPTNKKAHEIISKWSNSPGSVLIGTERTLNFLNRKADNSAIISIDPLFALPDWRMNEKVFLLLTSIRLETTRKIIMQTRIDSPIIDFARKGNVLDFYRSELGKREKFNYPPFITLIKLTVEGSGDQIETEVTRVTEVLELWSPKKFQSLAGTSHGKVRMNILLRLPKNTWPDKKLYTVLQDLPPFWSINVDPDNLM
jgi:primosomal protein N'